MFLRRHFPFSLSRRALGFDCGPFGAWRGRSGVVEGCCCESQSGRLSPWLSWITGLGPCGFVCPTLTFPRQHSPLWQRQERTGSSATPCDRGRGNLSVRAARSRPSGAAHAREAVPQGPSAPNVDRKLQFRCLSTDTGRDGAQDPDTPSETRFVRKGSWTVTRHGASGGPV